MVDAIRSPRQDTADGLERAALATNAAQDGRLSVLEAEDLTPAELDDPRARLVFRVRIAASPNVGSPTYLP